MSSSKSQENRSPPGGSCPRLDQAKKDPKVPERLPTVDRPKRQGQSVLKVVANKGPPIPKVGPIPEQRTTTKKPLGTGLPAVKSAAFTDPIPEVRNTTKKTLGTGIPAVKPAAFTQPIHLVGLRTQVIKPGQVVPSPHITPGSSDQDKATPQAVVVVSDQSAYDEPVSQVEASVDEATTPQSEDDLTPLPLSVERFGGGDANASSVTFEDIDPNDGTVSTVTEYVQDIDSYMFKLEKSHGISENYLKNRSITPLMREIVLDWVMAVHVRSTWPLETLYLAVKLIDRFIELDHIITKFELQLVAITSLFLATKMEEVDVPPITDYVAVTGNAFEPVEVRKMECRILKAIKFDLAFPVPTLFLRRCATALQLEVIPYTLAKYIAEMSLLDYNLVHVFPSKIGAASVVLSIIILNTGPIETFWTETMVQYSHYTLRELKSVIKGLATSLERRYNPDQRTEVEVEACFKKYGETRFFKVSNLPVLRTGQWRQQFDTVMKTI